MKYVLRLISLPFIICIVVIARLWGIVQLSFWYMKHGGDENGFGAFEKSQH